MDEGQASSLSSSFSSSCYFPGSLDDERTAGGDGGASVQFSHGEQRTRAGRSASAEEHRRANDEQDFSPERYLLWHKKATLQRIRVGPGRSTEMCRLYTFWLNFLPDKFNDAMYQAFKRYAEEDASAGHTFGLTCLFRFYLKYLPQDFEPEVYRDFETLALKYQDYLDYEEGMECLCQYLATATNMSGSSLSALPAQTQPSNPRSPLTLSPAHLCAPLSSAASYPMGTSPCTAMTSGLLSTAGSANSSFSSAIVLLPPGLPRDAGVEVDARVLQQLHAWQAVQLAKSVRGLGDDGSHSTHSDALAPESLTGSSEAGGEVDMSTATMLPPKRLGRRPNGKLAQALRRASARAPSPPSAMVLGSSPPVLSPMVGSAPAGAGRYMAGLGKAHAGAPHHAPKPDGSRKLKPSKGAGGGKRGGGNAAMDLSGTSPSSRNKASGKGMPGTGGRSRSGTPAQVGNGFAGKGYGRGAVLDPAALIQEEVDLWEAKPCTATCGAAAAEIVKVLPLRLGELFGD